MNGCQIQISTDGCTLDFIPGTLLGGTVTHSCGLDRSISYFLEFVTWIVPIIKFTITLQLEGLTNHPADPSVDYIRYSSVNLFRKFQYGESTEINIIRRGYAPTGGGLVVFVCHPLLSIPSIDLTDIGSFIKVRGTV
ncbi:putative RNA 3'-terminal phosphate cyclase-like protein [Thelohanellus kitauei]|uniref:Putative RNA 3'-terminal phosphate cyclase-like protein n=1 Tax=Thelohanellus kitauei TaxID=669202 RepID=A0A0C2JJG4_THEKT|nr:putative RNA 3'-terminal phosphate cyclase-like protein [Thelohanellus kitauei]